MRKAVSYFWVWQCYVLLFEYEIYTLLKWVTKVSTFAFCQCHLQLTTCLQPTLLFFFIPIFFSNFFVSTNNIYLGLKYNFGYLFHFLFYFNIFKFIKFCPLTFINLPKQIRDDTSYKHLSYRLMIDWYS